MIVLMTHAALVQGIDVSAWQGKIDWFKVAAAPAPYAFAYVRVSHGVQLDDRSAMNIPTARAAGLRVGTYHYLEAAEDAGAQAKAFLAALPADVAALPPLLPPALDLEEGGRDAGSRALAWLAIVEEALGVRPLVYTSAGFGERVQLGTHPELASYPLWVAHWTSSAAPLVPRPWTSWVMWQKNNKLAVPGIAGLVDHDLAPVLPEPLEL